MSNRHVNLHLFCSAKGGVGKSTLSVACGQVLRKLGGYVVVIDADLTGSSLADGIFLRAPLMPQDLGGRLDLEAPPTGRFIEPEDVAVFRRRRNRFDPTEPHYIPFLNDALTYMGRSGQECRLDAMLWRDADDSGVLYLPSSSLKQDIAVALEWLFDSDTHRWTRRLAWILHGLVGLLPEMTDVVIDLPPGLFGYTQETLRLAAKMTSNEEIGHGFPSWREAQVAWRVNPMLVMSQDRNDLLLALESYAVLYLQLPTLHPVVNRTTDHPDAIRRRVMDLLPDLSGLEQKLTIQESRSNDLGRIFRDGRLKFPDEHIMDELGRKLRLRDDA